MDTRTRLAQLSAAALVALAGTGVALAQDSTGLISVQNTTPTDAEPVGDALDPWDASQQVEQYVADLAVFESSAGRFFGIAPIAKGSRISPNDFFSSLVSSQAISQDALFAAPAPFAGSYDEWVDAPGVGVNPTLNAAPTGSASPAGATYQLGFAFAEFGGDPLGPGNDTNNLIGGLVNIDPADQNRLYVSRVVGLVNKDGGPSFANAAQLGFGAVDAAGNSVVRVDDFGTTAGNDVLGNNIVGLDFTNRSNGATAPLNSGTLAAGVLFDGIVVSSGTTHNVPGFVPGSTIAGGSYIGVNFDGNYRYQTTPTSAATQGPGAFRPGTSDQRGAAGFYTTNWFGGSNVGLGHVLSKDADSNPSGATNAISVWAVDNTAAANVTGLAGGRADGFYKLTLPVYASEGDQDLSDPIDAFTVDGSANESAEFYLYRSQVAFRGPSSQADAVVNLDGDLLVSGTVDIDAAGPQADFPVAIAVARVDAATDNIDWTIGAWITDSDGKPVKDGSGNAVGRLIPQTVLGAFGQRGIVPLTASGPSLSIAAFDSAGNIYFLSPIQIQRGAALEPFLAPADLFVNGEPNPERDLYEFGLIRGVFDSASFGYDLELIARTGQVFDGPNSGTQYLLNDISIADSNSYSSGAFGSGNVTASAFNGAAVADYADANALGGLVFNAEIIYDVDNADTVDQPQDLDPNAADGFEGGLPLEIGGEGPFEDPTSSGATDTPGVFLRLFPNSEDQVYNTALYVGPAAAPAPACPGDVNGDGQTDVSDFFILGGNFGTTSGATRADGDLNGDGAVDVSDFFILGGDFGCPNN